MKCFYLSLRQLPAACVWFSHRHWLSDRVLFVSSTASSGIITVTHRRSSLILNYCIEKETRRSPFAVIPCNTSALQISRKEGDISGAGKCRHPKKKTGRMRLVVMVLGSHLLVMFCLFVLKQSAVKWMHLFSILNTPKLCKDTVLIQLYYHVNINNHLVFQIALFWW